MAVCMCSYKNNGLISLSSVLVAIVVNSMLTMRV